MLRKLVVCIATLLAFAAGTAAYAESSPYEIQLLRGSFTPAPGTRPSGLQRLAQAAAATPGQKVHVLLQLHEIPADFQDLVRAGVDFGPYATGRAWVVGIPAAVLQTISTRPDVRALVLWDATRKVHPRVAAGDYAPWTRDESRPGWAMLFVQLHHDVPIENGYALADAIGGAAMPPVEGLHGMTIWVEEGKVKDLAASEDVLWIQEGPPPLTETNDGVRGTMKVDVVNNAPYNLTGTGVRAFVFDGGTVRSTHETFNSGGGSRVTNLDATAISSHSTHVAGTVGGDGAPSSAGGRGRGVATGTTILSAGYQQVGGTMLFWDNAGDIETDYTLGRNTHNADLVNNSIGSNTAANGYPCTREGDYDLTGSLLDGIVRDDNPSINGSVILAWAAGNERGGAAGRCGANYNTTAPPSCAKNPIHVGALNSDGGSMTSFSSWGPCDDGRLKPVISAPGCETGRVTGETFVYSSLSSSDVAYGGFCGTSMATPAVTGTIALLIQDWRNRGFGGVNDRPLPALVKGWLIHGARDLGLDGPDFIYGYGGVNAQKTVDIERGGNGTLGDAATAWGTDSATNGSIDSFFVTVPANTAELKATLAWDDFAAAAFTASAPVNNLTLELIAPDTSVRQAFVLNAGSPNQAATTGANALDNQEQVLVQSPAAGVWTVRVTGTSVPQGPQTYSLIYTYAGTPIDPGTCATTSSTYEAGTDSWTLTGATRVAAPAAGHGSFSLQFGGANSTTHEATRDFTIPAGATKAEWTFFWYMTTLEGSSGFGYDSFRAEVRSTTGTVLAVVDTRYDGWTAATWLRMENIDLTPWAGQTVRLAFRAVNDTTLPSTFWVDDVGAETCGGGGPLPPVTLTFTSVANQDGRVLESGENSNVGGSNNSNASNTSALRVGDDNQNRQFKTIVSFDTSSIPDTATILSVTVRLRRGSVTGANPFTTHGTCQVDIQNGSGFGGSTALANADFQAAATAVGVTSLSNALANNDWSEGALNAAGLAAINKTGTTQLRAYFSLDDNNDNGNDYMGYYSGNDGKLGQPAAARRHLPAVDGQGKRRLLGGTPRRSLWTVALRKLDQLDSAESLDDLRSPPGNRLEALAGHREGQHGIRAGIAEAAELKRIGSLQLAPAAVSH